MSDNFNLVNNQILQLCGPMFYSATFGQAFESNKYSSYIVHDTAACRFALLYIVGGTNLFLGVERLVHPFIMDNFVALSADIYFGSPPFSPETSRAKSQLGSL
jgi:hypothetical protein